MDKPCFEAMEEFEDNNTGRVIAVVCGYLLESENYVIEPRFKDHSDFFYQSGWYLGLKELVDFGILYHKAKGTYIVNKAFITKYTDTEDGPVPI